MTRPLQNRVTPFAEIVAVSERGTMMGNRGGRLHDDDKRLGRRRWASKAWICCELRFKGRHREVMAPHSYTELFFLDEVTALAAGHRPCFECRRADAQAFAAAFPERDVRAGRMDEILHAERLGPRAHENSSELPDGAVWEEANVETTSATNMRFAYVRREGATYCWSPSRWIPMPNWTDRSVLVLTPPSIVAALRNGFRPRWHD